MRSLLVILILLAPIFASAHQTSTSFIKIEQQETDNQLKGSLKVNWFDLNQALSIDSDQNGKLTWGEVLRSKNKIHNYIENNIFFSDSNDHCNLDFNDYIQIEELLDEAYMYIEFNVKCTELNTFTLNYFLLFDHFSNHKALVSLARNTETINKIISNDNKTIIFNAVPETVWNVFKNFLIEGIWHIWIGFDHILFLIVLLLPACLIRKNNRWESQTSISAVIKNTTLLVSSFTLAHTVTLSLATLKLVSFNPQLIEITIALSIVVCALNNVLNFLKSNYILVFAFGLLHGFGFANVLGELINSANDATVPLLAFNLGVEVGQLAILLFLLPILFFISSQRWYKSKGIYVLSIISAICGTYWLIERI